MPIPKAAQFTAWSYSRLRDYEECPFRARLRHLERRKEPTSPALEHGSKVHELAERFTSGQLKGAAPAELARFAKELQQLRRAAPRAEQRWAFTQAWLPCDWYGPAAWCRMVVDVYTVKQGTMRIIDYKTGKVRDGYEEQLSLYALGGLLQPGVTLATVELWYLDQGVVLPDPPVVYRRQDVARLKRSWGKRAAPLLADTTFAPRPGAYCRWCHFSAAKDGPCVY